ncbi:MAG: hypothetical protein FWH55_14430 [Oscillospiraceae bacterium]|nr:hypothetical protein [Oscillospiraceae bacterium]
MSTSEYHDRTLLKLDFYHLNGTINEELIHEAAQRHIDMLRDFVPEKTLRELHQHLRVCISLKDWHSAAICLSTYLGIAAEWLEKYIFQLTADEQAIQCYAKRIESLLGAE